MVNYNTLEPIHKLAIPQIVPYKQLKRLIGKVTVDSDVLPRWHASSLHGQLGPHDCSVLLHDMFCMSNLKEFQVTRQQHRNC